MHPVIALALVMVGGVVAIRLPRFPTLPPILTLSSNAGAALLLLGLLLGPWSGVLDDATLAELTPVLALAIGWVGARFGTRFERRWVRRLPRAVWLLAAAQALGAVALVGLVTTVLIVAIPGLRASWPTPRVTTVLALAALAAVSAPDLITLAGRQAGVGPRTLRRWRAAAVLDSAAGALLVTLALGARRFGLAGGVPIAVGSGVLVGLLVAWWQRLDQDDQTVTLLGASLLGAGAAVAAGVPPFVVCAVAGATALRYSPRPRRLARRFAAWERPMLAVLLLLTGALLRVPFAWVIPAGVLFAGVRLAARWVAVRYGPVLWRGLGPIGQPAGMAGLAGVAQGGITMALVAGWHLARPGAGSAALLTAAVIGAACAQLAAPPCMARTARSREL